MSSCGAKLRALRSASIVFETRALLIFLSGATRIDRLFEDDRMASFTEILPLVDLRIRYPHCPTQLNAIVDFVFLAWKSVSTE